MGDRKIDSSKLKLAVHNFRKLLESKGDEALGDTSLARKDAYHAAKTLLQDQSSFFRLEQHDLKHPIICPCFRREGKRSARKKCEAVQNKLGVKRVPDEWREQVAACFKRTGKEERD